MIRKFYNNKYLSDVDLLYTRNTRVEFIWRALRIDNFCLFVDKRELRTRSN